MAALISVVSCPMSTGAAAGPASRAARPDSGGGGGAAAFTTNLKSGGFCSESRSWKPVSNVKSPRPSLLRVTR